MSAISPKKDYSTRFSSDYLTYPLCAYHDKVIQTFDAFPKDGLLQELALRICALVLAPVAYPFLGILYVIGKWIESASSETPLFISDGKKLQLQIDELRSSGNPRWRELAIRLIRHSRKDNYQMELKRLRDANALDSFSEQSLDNSLNHVSIESGYITSSRQQQIKTLYAQAIELKKLYQDTHYVFLHGQSSPWLAISHLVKELTRVNEPAADLHQFKFLRAPCSTAEPGAIESISRFFSTLTSTQGVQRYSDRWFQSLTLWDHDPKVREELLSSDGFIFNYSRYESAMHFLSNNINIMSDYSSIEKVAKIAICHFYPSLSESQLSHYSKKIVGSISSKPFPCGNLFVLCIPKDSPQKVHYRAHPFGKVCQCHAKEKDAAILEKLQKGILDAGTKCDSALTIPVPQYRLYLPDIQPGKEQKIFLLSPLSRSDRKQIKSAIRNAVQELHRTAG